MRRVLPCLALTIPLPPIAKGGCPLPVYPASPTLEALFGARNPVISAQRRCSLVETAMVRSPAPLTTMS